MNPWASAVSPDPHNMPQTPRQRLVDPDASESERSYAVVTHLSLLAMHATAAIPVLGPILWYIRRHDSPFLNDHGAEAVNFQISVLIYALVFGVLTLCGIGVVLLVALYIFAIVQCIMAAVAAHKGEFFRYAMCIRLIG